MPLASAHLGQVMAQRNSSSRPGRTAFPQRAASSPTSRIQARTVCRHTITLKNHKQQSRLRATAFAQGYNCTCVFYLNGEGLKGKLCHVENRQVSSATLVLHKRLRLDAAEWRGSESPPRPPLKAAAPHCLSDRFHRNDDNTLDGDKSSRSEPKLNRK